MPSVPRWRQFFTYCIIFFLGIQAYTVFLRSSNAVHRVPASSSAAGELYQIMQSYEQRDPIQDRDVPFKKILFWNEAYGGKDYIIGRGKSVFQDAGCPVWQCETSDDRHAQPVEDYDAVLFHLRSFNLRDLPKKRKPEQRYILWSIESPAYRFTSPRILNGIFNWTMTYRWDSDIVQPYGWVEPAENLPIHLEKHQLLAKVQEMKESGKNYAEGKTKMVAWFVSNCKTPSNRMSYVKKLRKYIDVDIYGACGNLMCPRSREKQCREMVERDYKFYISFENSLCIDYVTEKFFSTLKSNTIPVTLGIHDEHEKFAPPHSFINGAKFKTVKALASYLKILDRNDTLYNEYFWWKSHYKIRDSESDIKKSMCELCAKLHQDSPSTKVYANVTDWWETKSDCKTLHFY